MVTVSQVPFRAATFSLQGTGSGELGAREGSHFTQPYRIPINAPERMRPGITPEMRSLPIDCSVSIPKMTKPRLGGIRKSTVAPAARFPRRAGVVKPSHLGIAFPVVAEAATDDPETAEKPAIAAIVAIPRPPAIFLTTYQGIVKVAAET
jgi:hypothetical protein